MRPFSFRRARGCGVARCFAGSAAPTDAGTYTVVAAFTSADPRYGSTQSTPVPLNHYAGATHLHHRRGRTTYGSAADLASQLGATIPTGVHGERLAVQFASSGDSATAAVGSYAITGTLAVTASPAGTVATDTPTFAWEAVAGPPATSSRSPIPVRAAWC